MENTEITFRNDFERDAWVKAVVEFGSAVKGDQFIEELRKRYQTRAGYCIVLEKVGLMPINVIKAVRATTNRSLQEAKYVVDHTPYIIAEDVAAEDLPRYRKEFAHTGASIREEPEL